MRTLLLAILLISTSAISYSQKEIDLKKKYLGNYSGQIPGYKYDTGSEVLDVAPTAIRIQLEEGKITLAIGSEVLTGTYYVMFKAKTYFLLDCDIDGQLASERIMVYKHGNRLRRDGMYPQPVSELTKK